MLISAPLVQTREYLFQQGRLRHIHWWQTSAGLHVLLKKIWMKKQKKVIKLNLVQGFPLAKASSVAYGTRSKGHGKNDNLACGKRVIKCRNSRSHLPTRSRVSAYPDPSRFMLVLFANLKAGFSPSEPDGAGVVSIWIPASHHSVSFHSEFSITGSPKKLSTWNKTN